MLALKTLGSNDAPGKTLIFDEVDTGIGGAVADVVGVRLQNLAKRFQVLCITHLPQIAAHGGTHLSHRRSRSDREGPSTRVDRLAAGARQEELARMIGGNDVSAAVLASAREMLATRERRGERRINGKSESGADFREIHMKYLIETHGCQMNVHDSERMAGLLEQAGYEPTADDGDADVIVINTCSVRERAEEKLFTRLGEIRQQGIERGARPVVAVAGCVAQQEGRQHPRALVGRRRHHRHAEHQAPADARRAGDGVPAPAHVARSSTSIRSTTCRSLWASRGGPIRSRRT